MDQEKTYKWIQDRIRDLHAGTLTAEDRLRMEELAKTDPFVQDAMEGYQANPDHDHSVLLKVIADRIKYKNASRRPKILPLSRGWVIPAVAASLVLILATWAVMFYIEKQGDAVFVAAEPKASTSIEHSTEVNLSDADSLKADVVVNTEKAESREQGAGDSRHANNESKEKYDVVANHKHAPKDLADDSKNIEGTIADKEVRESEDALSKEPVATSPASPITQAPVRSAVEMSADKSMAAGAPASKLNTKKDEGYYANQMNPDLMSRRVSGKVIDEMTGETVIYAFISIANTTLNTTTDLDGRFEIFLPFQKATLQVHYTGYPNAVQEVTQGQEDIVIKLKQASMPPMVIPQFPYKNQHQNGKLYTSDIDLINYIIKNSIFPIQSGNTFFNTGVTLNFEISQNGRPEKIKVSASNGEKKYELEAIRLIHDGPDWQCDGDVYPCEKEFSFYFK